MEELEKPAIVTKPPVVKKKPLDADEINALQIEEAKKAGKEYQGRETDKPRGDL